MIYPEAFTFHYGSITISNCVAPWVAEVIFTFHYGSITIIYALLNLHLILYLHSIMVQLL